MAVVLGTVKVGEPKVNPMRCWTFTAFDYDKPENWTELPDHCKYLVWQLEKCPDTGSLHLQGYAHFSSPCRLRGAQSRLRLPTSTHMEIAQAEDDKNRAYCTKLETRIEGPWELGHFTQPGERTDLECVVHMVQDNKSDYEIATTYPLAFCKYFKGFRELRSVLDRPEIRPDVKVFVVWGPTRVGKSHAVYATYGIENIFTATFTKNEFWWSGYERQPILLFEEFVGQRPINEMKKIMDKYPFRTNPKGTQQQLAHWTCVVFTSNINPENWYPMSSKDDRDAFLARFTDVIHMEDRKQQGEVMDRLKKYM